MTQLDFLTQEFPKLLAGIDPTTPPAWGKMQVQQMVEHMNDSLRIANGRDLKVCVTPAEKLPGMRHFLASSKPFRENTVNIQLPTEPMPCRWPSIEDALGALHEELQEYISVFGQDKQKTITNPFFGDLNLEEWTQLLTKHALHHLRQFGVLPEVSIDPFGTN
ncbi:MAG: DinB family protein [Bacteroidetes bacterium]|nr:DinB family protein [Bacteroidota bacterium]